MKTLYRYLCLFMLFTCSYAHAWTAGEDLDVLMDDFLGAVPADIQAEQQGWFFYTLQHCYALPAGSCWGANPSSPYGMPLFNDSGNNATHLREDEAIVYLIKTPPTVRYFSLIPYLHTATRENVTETIFASLDEPLNHLKIITTGSLNAGENVYDQLTVAVMTPDLNTFTSVQQIFINIGFPEEAVQLLAVPPSLNLQLGQAVNDDSFTSLMRVAVPENVQALAEYIKPLARSVRVFRMTPVVKGESIPVPHVPFDEPGSGDEPPILAWALDNLVKKIKANYASANLQEKQAKSWSPYGIDCVINFKVCGGDNYDAVYTREAVGLKNDTTLGDFTIIVGVNHHLLNKAVYINHTISDPAKQAGVAAFTDKQLTGSAAYHAGITDPGDPWLFLYQYLYAYAVAPDCNGMQYCLEVPLATGDNPVGIAEGAKYDIVGRVYLDPATKVRPLVDNLILPMVLRPL